MKMMNFRIRSIVLLLLLNCAATIGQNNVDSLKGWLKTSQNGEATVNTLHALCEIYLDQKLTDSVPAYLAKAKTLSVELDYASGLAKNLQLEGRADGLKGNISSAIKKIQESIRLFEQAGEKPEIAKSWFLLAAVYDFNDEQYKAIEIYQKSIQLFNQCKKGTPEQARNWKKMIGLANWRIGTNYEDDGQYALALGHYQSALDALQAIQEDKYTAAVLNNFGNTYLALNEPRKAIPYYRAALELFEKMNFTDGIGMVNLNMGDVYTKLGMPDSALYFLGLSEKLYRKTNSGFRLAEVLYSEAVLLLQKNELDVALSKLQESLPIVQNNLNRNLFANIQNQLGEIYRRKGAYAQSEMYLDTARALILGLNLKPLLRDNACYSSKLYEDWARVSPDGQTSMLLNRSLNYFKLYKSYQDSIFNEEKHKELTQQEMTYAFEKKQTAIQEKVNAQRIILQGLILGFVLVVLFSIAVIRQRNKVKKEKKRSDALLLNILPAEVAEELKAKGSADAKMIDEVTVLFSDFKDFTQLSETLTPEDLVAEINECFSAFDRIMQKNGVEKIKTVGDAYLAAGGLPTPNSTHAVNVMNAALEMQDFMLVRKQLRESAGKFFFEARIGVHTGPVVAGIVGIKKFAYDIWGDTVNTAQRMESSGEAGKVNISESTYALVRKQFNCVYRGMISTKGKGEVGMYFVESHQPAGETAASRTTEQADVH